MQIVRAWAVASQVQDYLLLREGSDPPIFREHVLQCFSSLDLAQGLNQLLFPELTYILGKGSLQHGWIFLLKADTNALDCFDRGIEGRVVRSYSGLISH